MYRKFWDFCLNKDHVKKEEIKIVEGIFLFSCKSKSITFLLDKCKSSPNTSFFPHKISSVVSSWSNVCLPVRKMPQSVRKTRYNLFQKKKIYIYIYSRIQGERVDAAHAIFTSSPLLCCLSSSPILHLGDRLSTLLTPLRYSIHLFTAMIWIPISELYLYNH